MPDGRRGRSRDACARDGVHRRRDRAGGDARAAAGHVGVHLRRRLQRRRSARRRRQARELHQAGDRLPGELPPRACRRRVPNGYYERSTQQWIPDSDGRVIKVLSESGGIAALDVERQAGRRRRRRARGARDRRGRAARARRPLRAGTGAVARPDEALLGLELRLPGPRRGTAGGRRWFKGSSRDPCHESGSVIECENQTLGEDIEVTGTPVGCITALIASPAGARTARDRYPADRRAARPGLIAVERAWTSPAVAGNGAAPTRYRRPEQVHIGLSGTARTRSDARCKAPSRRASALATSTRWRYRSEAASMTSAGRSAPRPRAATFELAAFCTTARLQQRAGIPRDPSGGRRREITVWRPTRRRSAAGTPARPGSAAGR